MGEDSEHHTWTVLPPVLSYRVMSNCFVGQKPTEELCFWNRRQGEGEPGSELAGGETGTSELVKGDSGEPWLLEQAG